MLYAPKLVPFVLFVYQIQIVIFENLEWQHCASYESVRRRPSTRHTARIWGSPHSLLPKYTAIKVQAIHLGQVTQVSLVTATPPPPFGWVALSWMM